MTLEKIAFFILFLCYILFSVALWTNPDIHFHDAIFKQAFTLAVVVLFGGLVVAIFKEGFDTDEQNG